MIVKLVLVRADTARVTFRALSLVVLLLALGVGGYAFSRQAQTVGPTSDVAQEAVSNATADVAAVNFQQAVPALETQRAATGSYTGAVLPPGSGVLLVRADAASYCLQAGVGTGVQHLAGPAGVPSPGPC